MVKSLGVEQFFMSHLPILLINIMDCRSYSPRKDTDYLPILRNRPVNFAIKCTKVKFLVHP